MHTFPVDRREGFVKINPLVFDLPDPTALFVIAIFSGIEDHPVAGLQGQRMLAINFDPARAAVGNYALQSTAFFAKFSVGKVRVVRA